MAMIWRAMDHQNAARLPWKTPLSLVECNWPLSILLMCSLRMNTASKAAFTCTPKEVMFNALADQLRISTLDQADRKHCNDCLESLGKR